MNRIGQILIAVVVLTWLGFVGYIYFTEFSYRSVLYTYKLRITAVDGITGTRLKVKQMGGPHYTSSDKIEPKSAFQFRGDGTVDLVGVDCEPRIIYVVVDGYENGEVVISKDVESAVTVALMPKASE